MVWAGKYPIVFLFFKQKWHTQGKQKQKRQQENIKNNKPTPEHKHQKIKKQKKNKRNKPMDHHIVCINSILAAPANLLHCFFSASFAVFLLFFI